MNAPFGSKPDDRSKAAAESNYVESIIGVAQAAVQPKQHPHPDGRPFVVTPAGFEVHELDVRNYPNRPKGKVQLRDADSFVAYVNRHKYEATTIYSQLDPASFTAVLNDNWPVDRDPDVIGSSNHPEYRDWRAVFTIPPSREWTLWHKANRSDFSQIGFAEFLEDNLPDIIEPAGNVLLELALNFEAVRAASFKGSHRLKDGSSSLQYVDETSGAGQIKVPDTFTLCIPVFENEAPRKVEARLKYRIKDGTLTLRFELIRSHKVLEAAYRDTLAKIVEGTGIKPLLGSPE